MEEPPGPEEIRTQGLPGSPTPFQRSVDESVYRPRSATSPPTPYFDGISKPNEGEQHKVRNTAKSSEQQGARGHHGRKSVYGNLVQKEIYVVIFEVQKVGDHVAFVLLDLEMCTHLLFVLPHSSLSQVCSDFDRALLAVLLGYFEYNSAHMEEAFGKLSHLTGGLSSTECQSEISKQLPILFVTAPCAILDFTLRDSTDYSVTPLLDEYTCCVILDDLVVLEWRWANEDRKWQLFRSTLPHEKDFLRRLNMIVDENYCSSYSVDSVCPTIAGYVPGSDSIVYCIDVFFREERSGTKARCSNFASARTITSFSLGTEDTSLYLLHYTIDTTRYKRLAMTPAQILDHGCWLILKNEMALQIFRVDLANSASYSTTLSVNANTRNLFANDRGALAAAIDARCSLVMSLGKDISRIDACTESTASSKLILRKTHLCSCRDEREPDDREIIHLRTQGIFAVRTWRYMERPECQLCWYFDVVDLFTGVIVHRSMTVIPGTFPLTLYGDRESENTSNSVEPIDSYTQWSLYHISVFDHDLSLNTVCEQIHSTLKMILAMASVRLSEQLESYNNNFEAQFAKLIDTVKVVDNLLRETIYSHILSDLLTDEKDSQLLWDKQLSSSRVSFGWYIFDWISHFLIQNPEQSLAYSRDRFMSLQDRVHIICFLSDWYRLLTGYVDTQGVSGYTVNKMMEFCSIFASINIASFCLMYLSTKYADCDDALGAVTEPTLLSMKLRHAVETFLPTNCPQQFSMTDYVLQLLAILEETVAFPFLVTANDQLCGITFQERGKIGDESGRTNRNESYFQSNKGNDLSFQAVLEPQIEVGVPEAHVTSNLSRERELVDGYDSVIANGAFRDLLKLSRQKRDWLTCFTERKYLDCRGYQAFTDATPQALLQLEYKWLLETLPSDIGENFWTTSHSSSDYHRHSVKCSLTDYTDNLGVWVLAFSGSSEDPVEAGDERCSLILLTLVSELVGIPLMDAAESFSLNNRSLHSFLYNFNAENNGETQAGPGENLEQLLTELLETKLRSTRPGKVNGVFSNTGSAQCHISVGQISLMDVARVLMRATNDSLLSVQIGTAVQFSNVRLAGKSSSFLSYPERFTFELMARLYYKVKPRKFIEFVNAIETCCPLFLKLSTAGRQHWSAKLSRGARFRWPLKEAMSSRLDEYCTVFNLTREFYTSDSSVSLQDLYEFSYSTHKKIQKALDDRDNQSIHVRAFHALPPIPIPLAPYSIEEGFNLFRVRAYTDLLRQVDMAFEAVHLLVWHNLWEDAIEILRAASTDEASFVTEMKELYSKFGCPNNPTLRFEEHSSRIDAFLETIDEAPGESDCGDWYPHLTSAADSRAETIVKHGQQSSEEYVVVFSTLLYHAIWYNRGDIVYSLAKFVPKSYSLEMLHSVLLKTTVLEGTNDDWMGEAAFDTAYVSFFPFNSLRLVIQLLAEQRKREAHYREEMSGKEKQDMMRRWTAHQ